MQVWWMKEEPLSPSNGRARKMTRSCLCQSGARISEAPAAAEESEASEGQSMVGREGWPIQASCQSIQFHAQSAGKSGGVDGDSLLIHP